MRKGLATLLLGGSLLFNSGCGRVVRMFSESTVASEVPSVVAPAPVTSVERGSLVNEGVAGTVPQYLADVSGRTYEVNEILDDLEQNRLPRWRSVTGRMAPLNKSADDRPDHLCVALFDNGYDLNNRLRSAFETSIEEENRDSVRIHVEQGTQELTTPPAYEISVVYSPETLQRMSETGIQTRIGLDLRTGQVTHATEPLNIRERNVFSEIQDVISDPETERYLRVYIPTNHVSASSRDSLENFWDFLNDFYEKRLEEELDPFRLVFSGPVFSSMYEMGDTFSESNALIAQLVTVQQRTEEGNYMSIAYYVPSARIPYHRLYDFVNKIAGLGVRALDWFVPVMSHPEELTTWNLNDDFRELRRDIPRLERRLERGSLEAQAAREMAAQYERFNDALETLVSNSTNLSPVKIRREYRGMLEDQEVLGGNPELGVGSQNPFANRMPSELAHQTEGISHRLWEDEETWKRLILGLWHRRVGEVSFDNVNGYPVPLFSVHSNEEDLEETRRELNRPYNVLFRSIPLRGNFLEEDNPIYWRQWVFPDLELLTSINVGQDGVWTNDQADDVSPMEHRKLFSREVTRLIRGLIELLGDYFPFTPW